MPNPDDDAPGRTLAVALGAMAGVALIVGVVIAVVVLLVVRLSGVGDATEAAREAPETLVLPKYKPTKSPEDDGLNLPKPGSSPSATRTRKPPAPDRIKLFVAPQSVSPGQRIDFSGVYEAGEGAVLQIQRKENGVWTDFPVSAIVRGGSFETWIQTTHTGRLPYRVYDEQARRSSNVVMLTVG